MKNTPLSKIYKCNTQELQTVLKTTGIDQFLLNQGIDFSELLEYSHTDLQELFGESYEIVKVNIYNLLKKGELGKDIGDHINILYNIIGEINISEEGLSDFNNLQNSEMMSEVFEKIKTKTYNLTDGISEETKSMIQYYDEHKENFRDKQKKAFLSYILYLVNGGKSGLIKLPTGTGKTFLFGHLIQSLKKPTLVLVPRINLVSGTYDEFVGSKNKKGIGFTNKDTFTIDSEKKKGSTSEQLEDILEKNNGEFKGTLIMTYQSLIKIKKADKFLYNFLKESVGFIVSDEAHRSLGKSTKDAIEELKEHYGEDIDQEIDLKLEIEVESDLQRLQGVIHLHTTATRMLSDKSIEEDLVFSSRFIDVVKDGDLICPKQPKIGKAYLKQISSNKNKNIGQYLEKYVGENGKPIYEHLTTEYKKQQKLNGGYLPTVAFANNTNQVEEYVLYLRSQGVKAIQCTTNKKGTHYKNISESELMLENGTADVVVTCSKVGEGWDLPTLRGAIWLCPSSSPARVLQGTGRITRTLKKSDVSRLSELTGTQKQYIQKSTNNTILFSPNSWEVLDQENYNDRFNDSDYDELDYHINDPGKSGDKKRSSVSNEGKVSEYYTGLELHVQEGEIDYDTAQELGIDYNDNNNLITESVLNYFKNYEGRTEEESYEYFMGLTGKEIVNIEHKGKKINGLVTLSGWKDIEGPSVYYPPGFQKFISWIHGKEIKKIGTEEVLNYFKNHEGKTEEESFEYFMGLIAEDLTDMMYEGIKIKGLVTLSGWKNKLGVNIQTLGGFKKFILGIFGKEEKETISTQEVLNYFKNYEEKTEIENYKYFMEFQKRDIANIKYRGKKIIGLVQICELENKDGLRVQSVVGFHKFISWVFGKKSAEIGIKKIGSNEVLRYFKSYEGRTEDESYKYFMDLGRDNIFNIEYRGKKIQGLSTLSGWENTNSLIPGRLKWFREFITWIFNQ